MPAIPTREANWYDYPEYYDIAFRGDTAREAKFIEACCKEYLPTRRAKGPRFRFLEPACGSGRLVVELARRGHDVVAYDLCPPMVDFVNQRLRRRKVSAKVMIGDMRTFQLTRKADAAFNLINTFRHLTKQGAIDHLRATAASLKEGGIYVLGIILIPEDTTADEAYERWTETFRQTRVTVTITVPKIDVAKRYEIMRTSMSVRNGKGSFRLVTDAKMQLYTPDDMRRLFAKVPEFEVVNTFDFWYDIRKPEVFDDRIGDVVFVLRKRSTKRGSAARRTRG
ncbi:class I SAM-dependent methyltransferase [bacterium]|nr:class I SAM-dependent methyltransferase [bacterium]